MDPYFWVQGVVFFKELHHFLKAGLYPSAKHKPDWFVSYVTNDSFSLVVYYFGRGVFCLFPSFLQTLFLFLLISPNPSGIPFTAFIHSEHNFNIRYPSSIRVFIPVASEHIIISAIKGVEHARGKLLLYFFKELSLISIHTGAVSVCYVFRSLIFFISALVFFELSGSFLNIYVTIVFIKGGIAIEAFNKIGVSV